MSRKMLCLFSAALLLGLTGTVHAKLVGHWGLDDGSGETATDSSGNGFDGTLIGNLTWISGQVGGALEFDGDSYVNCTDDRTLDITGPFSATLWIRPGTEGGGDSAAPLGKADASVGWSWQLRYGWGGGGRPFEMGWQFNSTGSRTWVFVEQPLLLDEWYHIAAAHDGTTVRCYLDGVETASEPMTGFASSATPLLIGSDGWRIDWIGAIDEVKIFDHGLSEAEVLAAMKLRPAELSYNPSPADNADDVPVDVTLSWLPGNHAVTHDLYLGTNWDDVNNASATDSLGVLVIQGLDVNEYIPAQGLELGQTYYWRADEVNGAPDYTAFKGDVWSFTTEPIGYPILELSATASSSRNADTGPEKTIDGSGLNALGQHGTVGEDMWLSAAGDVPPWIQYEFDKVYKLHEMRVWNSNRAIEPLMGLGAREVVIETSSDGNDWTALEDVTLFAQGTGKADYQYNTTVSLGGAMAKFVRITINTGYGTLPQRGLSEVRFLHVPTHAREPQPAPGENTAGVDVVLDWRAGREAVTHQVVFGSDSEAVSNGTAVVGTVTESRFDLSAQGVELGTTYFWKIVEINEAGTPTTYVGDLWSFSTPQYKVLDDLDQYDDECNRIFYTWLDGLGHSGSEDCGLEPFGGNDSGAIVGNVDPPYAEKDTVHQGTQSMPLVYDNSVPPHYSETQSKASSLLQDWTTEGADTLAISLRGHPVTLVEKPDGSLTVTSDSGDIWGTADDFRYAWKRLSGDGSIVLRVDSLLDTWAWAKAGVMIRDTLKPNSTHAMVVLTPSNGVAFQYRPTTAAPSQGVNQVDLHTPYWVKLSRTDETFTAARSEDGVTWVPITDDAAESSRAIAMAPDVYIGLAVTSNNLGTVTVAEFSEISTTGTVTGQWQTEDIGHAQPANAPVPLYVMLQDSAGQEQVVTHADLNAVLSAQWLTWQIPLIEFGSIDLSSVKSLVIGVGDRDNPSVGGAGKLYIDDIRIGKSVPAQ